MRRERDAVSQIRIYDIVVANSIAQFFTNPMYVLCINTETRYRAKINIMSLPFSLNPLIRGKIPSFRKNNFSISSFSIHECFKSVVHGRGDWPRASRISKLFHFRVFEFHHYSGSEKEEPIAATNK